MAGQVPPGWFPKRGEVYLANIDKWRPAVVLSIDLLNRTSLDVCLVPITSVPRRGFMLRVPLSAKEAGLNVDSWAKCDQVTTLEKKEIKHPRLGTVTSGKLQSIEEAVRLALGIPRTAPLPEPPQG